MPAGMAAQAFPGGGNWASSSKLCSLLNHSTSLLLHFSHLLHVYSGLEQLKPHSRHKTKWVPSCSVLTWPGIQRPSPWGKYTTLYIGSLNTKKETHRRTPFPHSQILQPRSKRSPLHLQGCGGILFIIADNSLTVRIRGNGWIHLEEPGGIKPQVSPVGSPQNTCIEPLNNSKESFPNVTTHWSAGHIQKTIHLMALFQGLPSDQGQPFLWFKFVLAQDLPPAQPWDVCEPRFSSHNPTAPSGELAWLLVLVKHRIPLGSALYLDFVQQPSSSLPDLGGICKKKGDVRKRSSGVLRVGFPWQAWGWELPAAPASFPEQMSTPCSIRPLPLQLQGNDSSELLLCRRE